MEPTNRSSLFSFIKIDLILILTVTGNYLSSILLTVRQENGVYEKDFSMSWVVVITRRFCVNKRPQTWLGSSFPVLSTSFVLNC